MKYLRINVRPRRNPSFCFLRDWPEGVSKRSHRFGRGQPFGADYPTDPRVYMNDREPGIELPSLVGNTRSMLVVHESVKDVIEAHNDGPTEYLPLHIYYHKKRLASDAYFAVHPLGTWDCLDLDASEIEYHGKKVVGVDRAVLDPDKLGDVPDLFRIREDPYKYVVSDALWQAVHEIEPAPTNLEAWPVEVRS